MADIESTSAAVRTIFAIPHNTPTSVAESLPGGYAFTDTVDAQLLARLAQRVGWPVVTEMVRFDRFYFHNQNLENAEFGVITSDEQLVGFGRLAYKGYSGSLSWLVVDPQHQHRGIGRSIIDARLHFAAENRVPSLYISQLAVTNSLAPYYQQRGFVENDEGKLLFGPEAMHTLKLSPNKISTLG